MSAGRSHYAGKLDVDALRESLAAFIQRHEIWRTTFASIDGQPMQLVQANGQWTWSVADLRGLAEAEREKEALRQAEEQAKQPFDLARGPLVRALLVRLGEQEHRLFMTLHQMIFDAVSLAQVFLPELRELYEARVQGRPPELEEVQLQYAHYASWQRESAAGGGAGGAAEVLEEVPGGRADGAGAAGGSLAASSAELPGRNAGVRAK